MTDWLIMADISSCAVQAVLFSNFIVVRSISYDAVSVAKYLWINHVTDAAMTSVAAGARCLRLSSRWSVRTDRTTPALNSGQSWGPQLGFASPPTDWYSGDRSSRRVGRNYDPVVRRGSLLCSRSCGPVETRRGLSTPQSIPLSPSSRPRTTRSLSVVALSRVVFDDWRIIFNHLDNCSCTKRNDTKYNGFSIDKIRHIPLIFHFRLIHFQLHFVINKIYMKAQRQKYGKAVVLAAIVSAQSALITTTPHQSHYSDRCTIPYSECSVVTMNN